MTAPTNTSTSLITVGNREDLADIIYRVAPEITPFMSNIGKETATAVYHEWQTQTLAAANPGNAQLEGDDITTLDAPNLTTRIGDTCQIFRKTGGVSGTEEKVKKAGRSSEMAMQKLLKGKELMRDQEARFVGNYPSVPVESGAVARKSAGALAWLVTNTSLGAGGANGGFSAGTVSAATNGTTRNFTETLLKSVMAAIYSNSGEMNKLIGLMGPIQKQEASAFTGIAQLRHETGAKMATVIGAADVYVSDFGEIAFQPHPYGLTRDFLLYNPDYWAIATLRPMATFPLAKTGDSDRFEMVAEKTLVSRNEKASGVVRDLQ